MKIPVPHHHVLASALPWTFWLLASFCGTTAQAQSWFPDEATWHYSYNSLFGQVGYVRIEIVGDTLINGQGCRILQPTREAYDHDSGQYFTHLLDKFHVVEANGLVQAYVPGSDAFDTLYHMSAVPGDRWRLARLPDWQVCSLDSYIQVVDTGTMELDGIGLRWLAVEVNFLPEAVNTYLDTIIERIGTTQVYMLPHDECNGWLDGHEAGGYRCYSDNEIDHAAPDALPCEFTVGLIERDHQTAFTVFPNPGNQINFRSSRSETQMTLHIQDSQGRMVHAGRVAIGVPLDLSHLAAGTYTYTVEDLEGGVVAKGRWVKH
jgi:hypothetical protein